MESGGIDAARIAAVRNTSVRIVDLPDAALGSTDGDSILIDMDASGYGWYVDSTPSSAIPAGPMDLVTVLAHEFGHRIRLTHEDAEQDRFAFMGATNESDLSHPCGDLSNIVFAGWVFGIEANEDSLVRNVEEPTRQS